MIGFVLKTVFVPGSIGFAVMAIVVATAVARGPRGRRRAAAVVGGTVLAHVALGTPLVTEQLVAPLARSRPLATSAEAAGARGIVVLGAGGGLECDLRVAEAARVYGLMGRPWIVASGGAGEPLEAYVMRERLIESGVPATRILLDIVSKNTREHALNLPGVLRAHGIGPFVLVTSAVHMPRAVATLKAGGLDPIPSPATDPFLAARRASLIPSVRAFGWSRSAIYEYGATAYYRARGWIAIAPGHRAASLYSTNR